MINFINEINFEITWSVTLPFGAVSLTFMLGPGRPWARPFPTVNSWAPMGTPFSYRQFLGAHGHALFLPSIPGRPWARPFHTVNSWAPMGTPLAYRVPTRRPWARPCLVVRRGEKPKLRGSNLVILGFMHGCP